MIWIIFCAVWKCRGIFHDWLTCSLPRKKIKIKRRKDWVAHYLIESWYFHLKIQVAWSKEPMIREIVRYEFNNWLMRHSSFKNLWTCLARNKDVGQKWNQITPFSSFVLWYNLTGGRYWRHKNKWIPEKKKKLNKNAMTNWYPELIKMHARSSISTINPNKKILRVGFSMKEIDRWRSELLCKDILEF